MKKQALSLLCILTIFSHSACNPFSKKPSAIWFYTHSTGKNVNKDTLLTPASFINLQKDGSYTRDFGEFEFGKWKENGENLLLTNASNSTTTFVIKYKGANDLQLMLSGEAVANFEGQPSVFSEKTGNPFSLENNKWRMRAYEKESEQQIKARLISHCKFWETYFRWALDNNISFIDVRSTPTPIKIYGNGFGLKPVEELPAMWRSYFYDSLDCRRGNTIIKEIFEHDNIAWAHTGNKYKMFMGAFQQLQQKLQ